MILSRLTLDLRHPRARRDVSDCQAMHRTILGCIGARREDGQVLYRLDAPALLVQSRAMPDWSRLPSGYARGAVALERVRLDWPAGAALAFALVAAPTKAVARPDGRGVRKALRGEEERREWIHRRLAAAGAEVVEVEMGEDVLAHGQHGRDRIVLPGVPFRGRLRVVQPPALAGALVGGIGSGKAYGRGLLTVEEWS